MSDNIVKIEGALHVEPNTIFRKAGVEIVHRCPKGREQQFPCCGRWPLEHLGDRITLDDDLVTCTGKPGTEREGR